MLIYVGGILVLIAVRGHADAPDRRRARLEPRRSGGCRRSLIVGVVGGGHGLRAVARASWHDGERRRAGADDLRHRQRASSDPYVLPFELASVVLLAALIGAVVLSRKELQD